uniref:Uncharacterized protein n=1 Tax=Anopheles farauti TaxID=69004 RepID=A0A182QJZ6_9DIPT
MTMWQSGGMGHGSQNNPWMKLMGIVHKERRHDNTQSQSGSNDRALNMGSCNPMPEVKIMLLAVAVSVRLYSVEVGAAAARGSKNVSNSGSKRHGVEAFCQSLRIVLSLKFQIDSVRSVHLGPIINHCLRIVLSIKA